MKMDVKYLKDFNKNKTKERYSEIENEYFPNDQKCEDCNSSIYYYDSTFRNSLNGELKKIGKSCHTVKEDDIIPVLNIKAKDIWDKDEKRYNNLKNNHNITTIVVWENDKPDINDIIKIIKDNE